MHFYRIAGLNVASDVAFAGMIATPPFDAADVRVRRGSPPASLDDPTHRGPNWQIADGRLLLSVPGIVKMLVSGGDEILFEPEAEVAEADTEIFLSGTGIGMLLHQRDQMVLHASAVRVGDRAVLFCGASGAGKSTLAAALGERGYALVTDDLAAIVLRNGKPHVEPDGRRHKLWQHAIDGLDLGARRSGAVRASLAKYHVEPAAVAGTALPVAAVYHLREARPPHPRGIERPNIVDAGLIVRRNAFRPAMVKRLGQQRIYLESAGALVAAGVFTLTRPLGFAQVSTDLDALEAHWADIGLHEGLRARA
ncbi:MAG: hypothetical protein J7483_07100 [Novosphingobium sp.]|nr:hypothetical protein [Novosphingobium sp.]